jgi:hypothetical protein
VDGRKYNNFAVKYQDYCPRPQGFTDHRAGSSIQEETLAAPRREIRTYTGIVHMPPFYRDTSDLETEGGGPEPYV